MYICVYMCIYVFMYVYISIYVYMYVYIIGRASLVLILRDVTRFTPLLARLVQ